MRAVDETSKGRISYDDDHGRPHAWRYGAQRLRYSPQSRQSPIYRIDGALERLEADTLTEESAQELLKQIASPLDITKYEKVKELDISYMYENVARFRVNVCRDDGDTRIVMRLIPLDILTLEALGLPAVLKKLCKLKNGLILFTAPRVAVNPHPWPP